MANYYSTTRSNYFRVKDEAAFRELMGRVQGTDEDVRLWDETDSDGNRLFGFGTYGGIAGIPNEEGECDDDSLDRFVYALKACVADDDAIIIIESGHEKLRYVGASAFIITSEKTEYQELIDTACDIARGMLGNDNWETKSYC